MEWVPQVQRRVLLTPHEAYRGHDQGETAIIQDHAAVGEGYRVAAREQVASYA